MWKHMFNFDVYEAVIERENKALGAHAVAMGELVKSLDQDPPPDWTKLAKWQSR